MATIHLPPMPLEAMVLLGEQQADRVLLGTKEELVPHWLLITGKGAVEVYATPWKNNDEKHLVTMTMREVMREKRCTAYSLLVECWFATIEGEEASQEYTGPPPSERPDRKEGVVIMAANGDGQHVHKHLEIVRGEDGNCVELKRLDKTEDKISSVLFDNLLHRGRPN